MLVVLGGAGGEKREAPMVRMREAPMVRRREAREGSEFERESYLPPNFCL